MIYTCVKYQGETSGEGRVNGEREGEEIGGCTLYMYMKIHVFHVFYENRIMKTVEIVARREKEDGENDGGSESN
jgi:hypothetical protein